MQLEQAVSRDRALWDTQPSEKAENLPLCLPQWDQRGQALNLIHRSSLKFSRTEDLHPFIRLVSGTAPTLGCPAPRLLSPGPL